MFEHLDQPVAQAFRVLPGQARHIPHVRMGERDDQAVVVHELADDAGLRHTEINLRDAGRPDELARTRRNRSGSPRASVSRTSASSCTRRRSRSPRGACRARVWRCGAACVAACGRPRAIRRPTPRTGRSWSPGACPWAVFVHVGVFRDSGAVHVRPPRDLRPGHSLTVQSPDILPFGHRYRHRPFLPERRRLQPADSFLGCVSGIYRHGGLVPVFVWAVIWCSFRWKPAAYAAEKRCRNCLRKIEAKQVKQLSHPIRDAWIEIRQ